MPDEGEARSARQRTREARQRTREAESRLRLRLTGVAIVVMLGLIVFVTVADDLGFGHGSEFIFGSLIGTMAILLGVQLPAVIRGRSPVDEDDDDD